MGGGRPEPAPYDPRLYGRRQDRALSPRQDALMADVLPKIAVPDPEKAPVDPLAMMPGASDVWLEIGFGGGEHLAWQAARNPDVLMIGAEPFLNGVAKLVTQVDEAGLSNVRVHFGDGRPLIEALADQSLGRMFVLHPDPWPKKRHYKRRIVSPWLPRSGGKADPAGRGVARRLGYSRLCALDAHARPAAK